MRIIFQFYRTSLTKQMHFKDKLIEKLLNEYNELNEFRSRNSQNTIEMVHNSLSMRLKSHKIINSSIDCVS